MPELPGPPAGYDDDQRRIWYEGASAVANLQAHQWAIIADQYRRAAEGQVDEAEGDDVDEVVQAADDPPDDEESDDGECPECGTPLVSGFGGERCPNCGAEPTETD